jgi:hypothetical protein
MTEFGKDVSCTTSMRVGRYATGVRLVAEAAYRRLTTPRGMLLGDEDEADYGIDLTELIGEVDSASLAASLPGRIVAELRKDERIEDATVSIASTKSGPSTTYVIQVTGETSEGPFTLQVGVSDVTVELLGIQTES